MRSLSPRTATISVCTTCNNYKDTQARRDMDVSMPLDKREYKRLKTQIHDAPILSEPALWAEIEAYGSMPENKKYYQKLKRKYWWHRRIQKKLYPLGTAPSAWLNSPDSFVSVIVPNYCHAPYLKERIDSILNQTFQNFELILLDDCSTDNSREILLSYKDHPKVSHVVLNEHNSGNTFLQWEKGVALAKGPYIWIAESDDYADETFLESVMSGFYLRPDCVLGRSGSYQVNQNGRVLVRDWDIWKEDETARYYDGNNYILHNLLHFNYIYNASMVVFRKDVFPKIDKAYQQLRYTGDWLFWIAFLQHGPMFEYRRKLNYFRQHQNKVSARSFSTNRGVVDQMKVMAFVISHIHLSPFRRLMLRGENYDLCHRALMSPTEQAVAEAFFNTLTNELHAKKWHYRVFKLICKFRFIPWVPTIENDKYK